MEKFYLADLEQYFPKEEKHIGFQLDVLGKLERQKLLISISYPAASSGSNFFTNRW